jgi:hypothetical protein
MRRNTRLLQAQPYAKNDIRSSTALSLRCSSYTRMACQSCCSPYLHRPIINVLCLAGFTPAQAVALSNITILGGSLANFMANSSRRHPLLNRPLIDWDLILVMEPTTMLGALLGGYLNKVRKVVNSKCSSSSSGSGSSRECCSSWVLCVSICLTAAAVQL